jgi:hypothetical protein
MAIPVQFDLPGPQFEIKIKILNRDLLDLDPPLVSNVFDLPLRLNSVDPGTSARLLKGHPAMASGTLSATTLKDRRPESILKVSRKKRY